MQKTAAFILFPVPEKTDKISQSVVHTLAGKYTQAYHPLDFFFQSRSRSKLIKIIEQNTSQPI